MVQLARRLHVLPCLLGEVLWFEVKVRDNRQQCGNLVGLDLPIPLYAKIGAERVENRVSRASRDLFSTLMITCPFVRYDPPNHCFQSAGILQKIGEGWDVGFGHFPKVQLLPFVCIDSRCQQVEVLPPGRGSGMSGRGYRRCPPQATGNVLHPSLEPVHLCLLACISDLLNDYRTLPGVEMVGRKSRKSGAKLQLLRVIQKDGGVHALMMTHSLVPRLQNRCGIVLSKI